MEAYCRISEKAFFNRNIKFGFRKSEIYLFNPAMVLQNLEIYSIIFSDLDSDFSILNNKEVYNIFIPQKLYNFRRQIYDISRKIGGIYRNIKTVIAKIGKAFDKYPLKMIYLKAENAKIKAFLKRYKPNKRQIVIRNFNKIFIDLPKIRFAEDKRQKRLRPINSKKQLSIDSFVTKEEPLKKRARK